MKKLLFLGLSVIYLLVMTFCEYTPDVIQYITNEDNYVEIEAKIVRVEYNETGYSYAYINLPDFTYFESFFGFMPASREQSTLDEIEVEIRIVPENAQILKERGFFDAVSAGDPVTVKTTCWLNNNLPHHYLAAVSREDEIFLSFEEGFEGVRSASIGIKDLDYGSILNQEQ